MRRMLLTISAISLGAVSGVPLAHADNKRLNDSVVANVFTVQHQAGCTNDVKISPQLQLAAQRHSLDVLNNRNLNGDIGSDGSGPQDRAAAAGYRGKVAETVAINPAMAISGVELINQWYYEPAYFAIMSNCANSQIGVWSENSPDRTVVVAVYGQPAVPAATPLKPPSVVALQENVPLDPRPDYDATDEIEYAVDWFPWILRGVNPPPGIPPE
ncbi:CAP domain-containing protein [Mycobacterium camsae]|uniref:CAP domain-containing protein n=1 Tax=Mycobacterium gordonae TaxID=1778 RepID=UPI001980EDC6